MQFESEHKKLKSRGAVVCRITEVSYFEAPYKATGNWGKKEGGIRTQELQRDAGPRDFK